MDLIELDDLVAGAEQLQAFVSYHEPIDQWIQD